MACNHIKEAVASKFKREDRSEKGKFSTCEECAKTVDSFVHLRLCKTCGSVLCCDSSPNTHMTKHNHATGHPVSQSIEEGEDWLYCYVDQDEANESSLVRHASKRNHAAKR